MTFNKLVWESNLPWCLIWKWQGGDVRALRASRRRFWNKFLWLVTLISICFLSALLISIGLGLVSISLVLAVYFWIFLAGHNIKFSLEDWRKLRQFKRELGHKAIGEICEELDFSSPIEELRGQAKKHLTSLACGVLICEKEKGDLAKAGIDGESRLKLRLEYLERLRREFKSALSVFCRFGLVDNSNQAPYYDAAREALGTRAASRTSGS